MAVWDHIAPNGSAKTQQKAFLTVPSKHSSIDIKELRNSVLDRRTGGSEYGLYMREDLGSDPQHQHISWAWLDEAVAPHLKRERGRSRRLGGQLA